ncbi:hypothetical protein SKUN_00119 [Spiroplasma kunkelii CR2-3x]|uniref:Uncharacterized protein n=1 Tax=Spiroplasma kunkelii CR2-3x TaxID=273035 RepID=A0A0K2JF22_SPIKU|nr:hypothetical protein SKUN_00119 [Spiroplasma kunkelii CR2-3x]
MTDFKNSLNNEKQFVILIQSKKWIKNNLFDKILTVRDVLLQTEIQKAIYRVWSNTENKIQVGMNIPIIPC